MTTPGIGDSRKSGEPSDADILSLAYDVDAMPEQMTDAGLRRFARALLARFGTRPAAEPSQSGSAGEAQKLRETLMAVEFALREMGMQCHGIYKEVQAALSTPPTPEAEPVQQDTRERFLVIRESHHNAAETEYFSARPHIDTADRRRVFYAGFCKGYDAKEDAS